MQLRIQVKRKITFCFRELRPMCPLELTCLPCRKQTCLLSQNYFQTCLLSQCITIQCVSFWSKMHSSNTNFKGFWSKKMWFVPLNGFYTSYLNTSLLLMWDPCNLLGTPTVIIIPRVHSVKVDTFKSSGVTFRNDDNLSLTHSCFRYIFLLGC